MTPALRAQLSAVIEAAQAASSSYRPAAAAYLFEAGLGRIWGALKAGDDALFVALWRLMLESVTTRRFGVSSDAWRVGDYPDRFFPALWLDLLPQALPLVPADQRLAWVNALFNLGENLPRAVRAQSNQLAEMLVHRADALVHDLEGTIRVALMDVGLLVPEVAQPNAWSRLTWLGGFDLAQFADDLVAGDLRRVEGGLVVVDAAGEPRLGLRVAADGLAVDPRIDLRADPIESPIELRGRTVWGPAGALGDVPGVAPAAVVCDANGDGALLDAGSLWIRRFRAG